MLEAELLEVCAVDQLLVIEQQYFDLLDPELNISRRAGKPITKWSEERKAAWGLRLAELNRQRVYDDNARRKQAEKTQGRRPTPRMLAVFNAPKTPRHKANISAGLLKYHDQRRKAPLTERG